MKTCEILDEKRPSGELITRLKDIMDKLPDDDQFLVKSEIFKAISDPTRLKILYLLADGELCVCEIIFALEKPQSTISHHLNVLKNAGFIKWRKEGVWIHYKLVNPSIVGIIEEMVKLI
ncbi:MAG TPA: metalloregulator ArsR/SmtB family transcription factor [Methanobacterium sp.]